MARKTRTAKPAKDKSPTPPRIPVRHNGLLCWQEANGSHTPLSPAELAEHQNTQ